MRHEEITYTIDSKIFKGYLVLPNVTYQHPWPAVLVAPAFWGRDDFACEKARALAALGYIAFVADMYGDAKVTTNPLEAGAWMTPLFKDRAELQKRIRAAFDQLISRHEVDKSKMGAIGFCFGGLGVLELLRSGAPVKGCVSFHGALADQMGGNKAKTVPIAKDIKGAFLALHGYKDPLVSNADLDKLEKELSAANIDWEINIYGLAAHAFTNPIANDPKTGMAYEPKTNARSWAAMKNFFEEMLS